MTLMLRPEIWRDMYSASGAGVYFPTGDPTLDTSLAADDGGRPLHRRIVAGLSCGRRTFNADEKRFLAGLGGKIAAVFGIVYLGAGIWASSVQPDAVKAGLWPRIRLYQFAGFAGYGWLALVAVAVLLAAVAGFGKRTAGWLGWAGALVALLVEIRSPSIAMVCAISRCSVRDTTFGIAWWLRIGRWSASSSPCSLPASALSDGSYGLWRGHKNQWRAQPERAQNYEPSSRILRTSFRNQWSTAKQQYPPRFLVAAAAAGLCYTAALAYPIYRYLASPEEMASSATAVTEVTLKDAQKLPPGSVLMFKFGTSPAMLIHHEDGRWVALTAVCTHWAALCNMSRRPTAFTARCHGGVYNAYTGANVSGPPPKPLKLFKVAVRKPASMFLAHDHCSLSTAYC